MRYSRHLSVVLALSVFLPSAALAQTSRLLLTEGIAAYNDLEFVAAIRLLTRALDPSQRPPLAVAEQVRALMYLGSAQLTSGDREAAVTTFRTLVITNPRYRPDSLVFPPSVTGLFAEAAQTTKAVAVTVADEQTVTGGRPVPIRIHASSPHLIAAVLFRGNTDTVAVLFDGPIEDSLTVAWNPLAAAARPLPPGSYRLEVASRLSPTTVVRAVLIPLEVQALTGDTAVAPSPPPAPPVLLPERRPKGRAFATLAAGLAAGGLLMIPTGGVRMIGGTIAVGGVVAFFLQKPGQPIPANIAANARAREASRPEPPSQPRRTDTGLIIKAGAAERIER